VIENVAEALFVGVAKVKVVGVARRDGATLRAAVIIRSIGSFIGVLFRKTYEWMRKIELNLETSQHLLSK